MRHTAVSSGRLALASLLVLPMALAAQRPTQPAQPTAQGRQIPAPPPRIDSIRYVRTDTPTDPVILKMWEEGTQRGQAMSLAQVFLDSIGPRLNNSDRFDAGQEWLVDLYAKWGIGAKRVQYGTWFKWRRGASHVNLVFPRERSLEATMLGWSPGTSRQWITADVVLLPDLKTPEEFVEWMRTTAKGKAVLTSPENPSCRMPSQVQEFARPGGAERLDSLRAAMAAAWRPRTLLGGNPNEWPKQAGVAAILTTNWSRFPGVNKIFGTPKQQVPTFDVSCEDYNLLFRLAKNNQAPKVNLYADSDNLGEQPVHNVIATIPGSSKPDEYIIFSAHYDSWDGASGATDNGTGTITMLEAARILKKIYPNPKRTIIVGHWGGEEQGLNGSRAWVEDNPKIVARVHAGFNQDNGTGRVTGIGPGPFVGGVDALVRYLSALPSDLTGIIRMSGTGGPALGGTDNAAFQCLQSPVYGLGALSWDYSNSTWHTNRDTYDKLVAEDLQGNAMLVAMLAYMADQDPALLSREVIELRDRDGAPQAWPTCPTANRDTKSSPR
jgi:carboxypeptidase Q